VVGLQPEGRTGCVVPEEATQHAAAKLGIACRTADGNLNAAGGYLNAFRLAPAASPSAILRALDCLSVKLTLLAAKARHIQDEAFPTRSAPLEPPESEPGDRPRLSLGSADPGDAWRAPRTEKAGSV
jgi:hypothetical protein